MSEVEAFEPREYQQNILDLTELHVANGFNVLIELDCGLGKRFLQYSLIGKTFKQKNILVILQASTSLYETYNYMEKYLSGVDMQLIDSRVPSKVRAHYLKSHQIIFCLPQTLSNTLERYPDAVREFDIVVINEVDQILKRMGISHSFKQPYPKLMPFFDKKMVIGMSGTLRDEHYILDRDQMRIKKELKSLLEIMGNTQIITMDMLESSDINEHIKMSEVIATGVDDFRLSMVSGELYVHIKEAKHRLMQFIKEENPELYAEAKRDMTKLFGPLPVPPKLAQDFHRGYLVRKYLWSMPGESSFHHLLNYGLDEDYLKSTLPRVPAKFLAIRGLVKAYNKSVVLCSYLDTVDTVSDLIENVGIPTVKITGQVPHHQRIEALDEFRQSNKQMVAVLSNVGERDLDIPEAELLIVFDLIRTAKTVYQKLKRSRGGICRILFYNETREQQKVNSVLQKIEEKYSWSTEIKPAELITFD